MLTRKSQRLFYWAVGLDMFALNAAFTIAQSFKFHSIFGGAPVASYRELIVIANILFLVIIFSIGRDVRGAPPNPFEGELHKARINYSAFVVFYLAVMVFIKGYEYSRTFQVYFLVLFGILNFMERRLLLPMVRDMILSGPRKVKVVLVGAGEIGRRYFERISRFKSHYDVVAVLDDNPSKKQYFNGEFKGSIDSLPGILAAQRIDEVIVSIPMRESRKINEIVQSADRHYTVVKVIPGYSRDLSWRKLHVEDFDGLFLFSLENSRMMSASNRMWKRAMDVLISLPVLVLIIPLLCIFVVPAIKLSSKGPVFFKQKRKGYHGREFVCLKFRTMKMCDKKVELNQAKRDDPRKTNVGHFLRKTNLDELPQFWNVFKGEMSVVGPRPHMVEHDEMYGKMIEDYHIRFYVKPGVTGWAQVSGYRGGTENPDLMRKRVEHDKWYIENWSPWLDFKIFVLTIGWMLRGDPNAY